MSRRRDEIAALHRDVRTVMERLDENATAAEAIVDRLDKLEAARPVIRVRASRAKPKEPRK